jgi:L-asparagine transporter-like permease
MLETHLRVIGALLVPLALLHAGFPRYFNWATEFEPLSLINRQMMYVHTLFIALLVLLTGLLCLSCAPELVHTHLGRVVCLGIGVFWLMRLLVQFVGYSSELWRGKRFETTVHVLFSVFWTYLTVVFLAVYWQ